MSSAPELRWIDRVVVEAVHLDLIRAHGGMPGIRDEHALESALARPRQRWSYDLSADLVALAAAYGLGLARNHPFYDGNKRIAFVVMAVFLGLNGYEIEATEEDVVSRMIGVGAGEVSEEALTAWTRSHLSPLLTSKLL